MIDVVVAQGTLPGATSLVPDAWRMAAGFFVVLALLALCAWVLKRTVAARRAAGSMHVETALSLGERRSLVIVTVEGRRLLLGTAPNYVSLVTELGAASFDKALATAAGTQEKRS